MFACFHDRLQRQERTRPFTSVLYGSLEVLNKLFVALSIVEYHVSLGLVHQTFKVWYAPSSDADEWVNVGLLR